MFTRGTNGPDSQSAEKGQQATRGKLGGRSLKVGAHERDTVGEEQRASHPKYQSPKEEGDVGLD